MSKTEKDIAQSIAELGKAGKYEIFEGSVSVVDEKQRTVDVEIEEGVELFDIKLRSVVGGGKDGIVLIPKVGSQIVFAQIRGEDDFILIATSELDKIIVDVEVSVEVNSPKILINGGDNGGIPIEKKVIDEINELKQVINDFKTLLTTWIPVPSDGGAALKTAISSWAGEMLVPTEAKALENPKVKH